MLEPFGEVDYNPLEWWKELFTKYPVPPAIGEIWIASRCDDGFGEAYLTFEKAFGGDP
jgi:hypothetical protein